MASWTYYEAGLTITDEDDGDICTMNDMAFGDDWESMHETGRLIAAAPDLLGSIKALLVISNSDEVLREIKLMPKRLQTARVNEHNARVQVAKERCRAAIRKATGEPS